MIPVRWDEEKRVFIPAPRFVDQLLKALRHGQRIFIERIELRSMKAHRRFFAELANRWETMPEHIRARFANSTHLRKFALISCGWIDDDIKDIACGTPEVAVIGAVCAKTSNRYAMITIRESVITIYQARSMRTTGEKCMTAKEFYQAADDVLAFLDAMLGIGKDEHEVFSEVEDIAHEALVRIGKAHHRAPLRIAHNSGANSADTDPRQD